MWRTLDRGATRLIGMSNNGSSTPKASWSGFLKAIVLVIIAVFFIRILGNVVSVVIGMVITAVIVIVIGVLLYGLFRGRRH